MWNYEVRPIAPDRRAELCGVCGTNKRLLMVRFVSMDNGHNTYKGVRCGDCAAEFVTDLGKEFGHAATVEDQPQPRVTLIGTH